MRITDDDRPEASTATTPLELLHQHVTTAGEVDLKALLASGVDLRQLRPALEQLRRARRLLLEFEADRINRITLLGPAYQERRTSTPTRIDNAQADPHVAAVQSSREPTSGDR